MTPTTTAERQLTGRVALVTGASRGIGAATARAFAAAGAAVVLAARSADALDEQVARITADGGQALAVPTDVTEAKAVEALIARTVAELGRLDVACNNAAGGGHRPTPLADVAIEDFDSALAGTLRSARGRRRNGPQPWPCPCVASAGPTRLPTPPSGSARTTRRS